MSRDAVHQFFDEFKEKFCLLVRETVAEELEPMGSARGVAPATDDIDEATRQAIAEQHLIASKSYLTRAEAATYLDVSERSIAEWSARARPIATHFPNRALAVRRGTSAKQSKSGPRGKARARG
ncbi:MAG TPA: hypothetical protein VEX60_10125 [Pyrinomonadaceae bacterium]|nr:hypothetical protein [Pyrinomonadaceae bacterium]